MKQFAYNLAYSCKDFSEAQEISEYLEKLGYNNKFKYDFIYPIVVNNFGPKNGCYGFGGQSLLFGRELIDSKELFLALAAQTLDKEFYVGEWVIQIDKAGLNTENGSIAKVGPRGNITAPSAKYLDIVWINKILVGGDYKDQGDGGYYHKTFRKMTKEEIIQHLTKQTNMKKIIGYKLIKHYPGVEKFSIGYIPPFTCTINGLSSDDFSKFPEFWEPIYEQEKKVITIPCEGGSFDVEIGLNYMKIGSDTLTRSEVELLIRLTLPAGVSGPKSWAIKCKFS